MTVDAPVVFASPEYEAFGDELCELLSARRGCVERREFPDGERYQRLEDPVAERDVILVGGTISDVATLSLYDLACAIVKYDARRLSMVIPYFGYSTMERAVRPGEVVTAKARARLLASIPPASAGNRVLLMDLHSEGIPHYFEGGTTAIHVQARPALLPIIARLGGEDFVVASTDAGRAKWVESIANDLGMESAFILKRRLSGSETRVTAVNALVESRPVVIYDDMIRTGGSLLNAARAYRDAGASRLAAVCTHGVFPGDAFERLQESGLFEHIAAADTYPRARELEDQGLEVVPVAALFVPHLRTAAASP